MEQIQNNYQNYLNKHNELQTYIETNESDFQKQLKQLQLHKEFIKSQEQLLQSLKQFEITISTTLQNSKNELETTKSEITQFINSQTNEQIKNEMIQQYQLIEKESLQLTNEQIKQLEQWTSKSFGKILFDSKVDNWSKETSVFHEKIMNHSHLLLIIEDEKEEIFGYYLHSEMKNEFNSYVNTTMESFLFNIQSNGRLNEMKQFKMMKEGLGYHLYKPSEEYLICFGDIMLMKYEKKENCCVFQNEYSVYNYDGLKSALCGSIPNAFGAMEFVPKRFKIVEMF